MTIRHLIVFLEIAAEKSVSKAANNLFISQPAVSQSLKDLEQHYNTQLFSRSNKQFALTPSGICLKEYAEKLISAYNETEQIMATFQDTPLINLGANFTIGAYVLPKIIEEALLKFSNLDINSYIDRGDYIEKMTLQHKIDFALVTKKPKSKDLLSIPFMNDSFIFVCAKTHQVLTKKNPLLTDLADFPFILAEKGSNSSEFINQLTKDYNLKFNVVAQYSEQNSIKKKVIKGEYITLISRIAVQEELKLGTLKEIPTEVTPLICNFYLIYHRKKVLTKLFKDFINWLTKSFSFPKN